jgi:CDP-diacylglycerol--glycerol-3-phosphate 3-phosphatidyltransferase
MSKNMNIPNVLSASRIIFLPILYIYFFIGTQLEFLIGYILLGATDWLDGFLARALHQVTHLGKILDTVADILFYFSTLFFITISYPYIIEANIIWLIIFMCFYLGAFITSTILFKKPIQLHTNHLRLNAVFVYFVLIVSTFTDATLFVSITLISFIVAYIEEIMIFILFGEVDIDTRSIWPLIKKRREANGLRKTKV